MYRLQNGVLKIWLTTKIRLELVGCIV
uniref:Uncharacterized protein n=1 Tax=Arundo donax TaxID=35708 RepID=A0A0A9APY9_ARUDO